VVPITYVRRLATLVALMAAAALWTLGAPASALTVTIPTLPAPLPLPLPTGASVSGGTGGAPVDVTVNGPDSTGTHVQLPGLPSPPALPIGPTGPVTAPVGKPTPPPVLTPSPVVVASPAHDGDSNAPVSNPDGGATVEAPVSPFDAGAARTVAPAESPRPNVGAVINARPADSLLHRVSTIGSRLVLWGALLAVVFVLHMLVGSAVRHQRRKSVRVS
jgi:hypothetical protein